MSITQPTPLSMWPDEIAEGDTIAYTGAAWHGEEFSNETLISWPVTVTEVIPESRYGGGFYAQTAPAPDGETFGEVFISSDEYRKRLAMVKSSRKGKSRS